jgi:murein DD-endopeptidase MepM/ murein hydrolase activator NlpD
VTVRQGAALIVVLLVAALAGGAIAAPRQPAATASALLVRLALPNAPPVSSGELVAPPASDVSAPYLYPDDGSLVRVGSAASSVAAQPGTSASAQAVVSALAVSLLAGEITAESVNVRASAAAGFAAASGSGAGSTISGLTALGQPLTAKPGETVTLGDWGTLDVLDVFEHTDPDPARAGEASVVGLRVTLSLDHGGLPAGTVIEVGTVSASADAGDRKEPTSTQPETKPTKPVTPKPRKRPAGAPQEPGTSVAGAPPELVKPAPEVTARLTDGGYVFPVFGPASFGDTFGAPRADLESGWHHGEDIVGPLGTPILAVADGTIFGVGWNELGGWKLWLRDGVGNEFYYAHLSAYSPLAVEGTRVRAGDVLGFMGDSGDAKGGPVHLHFEIHPAELLFMGYDGVVAPYPFLVAWRRAEDVSFAAGRRYVPGAGGGRGLAPPAGAVLLEIDDISRTSGLVPGALERAVTVERVNVAQLLRRGS